MAGMVDSAVFGRLVKEAAKRMAPASKHADIERSWDNSGRAKIGESSIQDYLVKWSCFLGQVCGLAKMQLVCVHAAFRISAWVKYAVSGVRLSRAV